MLVKISKLVLVCTLVLFSSTAYSDESASSGETYAEVEAQYKQAVLEWGQAKDELEAFVKVANRTLASTAPGITGGLVAEKLGALLKEKEEKVKAKEKAKDQLRKKLAKMKAAGQGG